MKVLREYHEGYPAYERIYMNDLLVFEFYQVENRNVHRTRKIIYDSNGKIIKENISDYIINEDSYEDHRYEVSYDYSGESYTKITKKKYIGHSDIDQYCNMMDGDFYKMYYKEIDQIDSILEVKISDGKKLVERYTSFSMEKNRETKYIYYYDLLVKIEGLHEIEKNEYYKSEYEYKFPDKLIKQTHFNQKGEISLQKVYDDKGVLKEELIPFPYCVDNFPKYIKTEFNDGLKIKLSYLFSIDDPNNILSDRFPSKINFGYDEEKKLITEEKYIKVNSLDFLFEKNVYEYETKNKSLVSKITTETNVDRIRNFHCDYYWVKLDGLKTEGFIITKTTEFEYDYKGNLFQKVEFKNNKPHERMKYFDFQDFGKKIIHEKYYDDDYQDEEYKWIAFKTEYFRNRFDLQGNPIMKSEIVIEDNKITKESTTFIDYHTDVNTITRFPVQNEYFTFIRGYVPITPF